MTAPEYAQLRAFARLDGLYLFLLWTASFSLYVLGLRQPLYGVMAIPLLMATPLLSFMLLRRYRDDAVGGILSFRRGWYYVVLQVFYGGVLFAMAQYVYFKYMDGGFFVSQLSQMLSAPENAALLKLPGVGDTISESMQLLRQMRPIDIALQMLTSNLLMGCLMALPLAAIARRDRLQKI